MADLSNLPTVQPPLIGRPSEMPLLDKGPEWIDAETVERVEQAMVEGHVTFPPNVAQAINAVTLEDLTEAFNRHLQASPLSAPWAINHRVHALTAAMREICDPQAIAQPLGRGQIEIAAVNLEAYLTAAVNDPVLPAELSEEHRRLLAHELSMLDAASVSSLTNISVATLAAWRNARTGPPFIRLGAQARQIRYPALLLLQWLYKRAG